MKKIVALTSPVFVLVMILLTVAALEAQRVPDWQKTLSNYLTQSPSSGFIRLRATTPASKPWNFIEAMGTPVRSGWTWGIEDIPFPPTAVQCVLLERSRRLDSGATAHTQQIVFVAHHSDNLWRIGWLIYKGPMAPFGPEVVDMLATVGCEMDIRVNSH